MTDDLVIPIKILGAEGGILAVVGGWLRWLLSNMNGRIERMEQGTMALSLAASDIAKALEISNARIAKDLVESNAKIALDLSDYKIDSEKRFAKEDTLQLSLGRIHERLDKTATSVEVHELRDDIKSLMSKRN